MFVFGVWSPRASRHLFEKSPPETTMMPALAKRTNVWEQLRALLIEQSGPEVGDDNDRLTPAPANGSPQSLGLVRTAR